MKSTGLPSNFPQNELHRRYKCPHCKGTCQFDLCGGTDRSCEVDETFHLPYLCQVCHGMIIVKYFYDGIFRFHSYIPSAGGYKRRVNLEKITSSKKVRDDFVEAINCYNNGSYNASMVMSRRAIQQEMIDRKFVTESNKDNLYKQIESSGISDNLKGLLKQIKNFGNFGAHPDFCLYYKEGKPIEDKDKKKYAELSLKFLDMYLSDQEAASLVAEAPKSKKELGK